jgi:hypothetical protein
VEERIGWEEACLNSGARGDPPREKTKMYVPKELLPSGDLGTKSMREQAEIILAHLGGREPLDPRFLMVHASALLQYAAGLERSVSGKESAEPYQLPCS